jgi:hypothetical protein
VNSKKHPEFFLSKDTRLNLPRWYEAQH